VWRRVSISFVAMVTNPGFQNPGEGPASSQLRSTPFQTRLPLCMTSVPFLVKIVTEGRDLFTTFCLNVLVLVFGEIRRYLLKNYIFVSVFGSYSCCFFSVIGA